MRISPVHPFDTQTSQAQLVETFAEHRDDAAFQWLQRTCAVDAPNWRLVDLAHLDEGLSADLDAMMQHASAIDFPDVAELAEFEVQDVFVAAARALLDDNHPIEHFVAAAERSRAAFDGWVSALGWVPTQTLQRIVSQGHPIIRSSSNAWYLALAEATRAQGGALQQHLASTERRTRQLALFAVGSLGARLLLPMIGNVPATPVSALGFHWARAAVLLGGRGRPVEVLTDIGTGSSSWSDAAFRLSLQVLAPPMGHEVLARSEGPTDNARRRIIGTGYVGDAKYVPWLIDQMSNPAVARIAAEAFVHITGADFNLDQLESMPPDDFEDGPTDDPDDEDVELPEDIALPWPDVERIKAWWMEHRSEFTPGQKLFLGKPITPEHCIHVLKTGYQRQRVIAAHYRCLIQPGTVLFPTSAPAWRQQKLLAAM